MGKIGATHADMVRYWIVRFEYQLSPSSEASQFIKLELTCE